MDQSKLNKYTKYFIEGKLSKEKENELLSWIKQNNDNRKLFIEIQNKYTCEMGIDKNPELKQSWKKLQQRLNIPNSALKSRQLFMRVASVAAAFLIGIFITVAIYNAVPSLNHEITQQNISVPYGGKTNITLPDGSVVWINSASSLSYPSEFGGKRLVSLSGEAYFDVTKSKKPFVILTDFGEVEVKGTSFNVQAYENETLQATLVSGSVLVREPVNKKEVLLSPGQQARIVDGKLVVNSVDTELFTSWKEGRLIFRKEYLPEVIKRLERWYNVKIQMDDDKRLNKIWFTGTIELESFSEVLDLLKVTSPIDYSYNEKTRIIKIVYKPN